MAPIDRTRPSRTRSKAQTQRPEQDELPRGHVTEIQRARMLSAAVEAIEENGYARLTVAQVINRAKVSRKTFYDLFVDREDCFLAVFERTLDQVSGRVVEAYAQESSWREGVRAGLAALLIFIDEEPELARLCVVDALGGGSRVLEMRAQLLDRLRTVIDSGRDAATTRREPPRVTAEGVVGAVFAVVYARMLERSPKPYIALHGQLMSMIVLPYLGTRAASRELTRPAPQVRRRAKAERGVGKDPMAGLDMRLTYRTVRVLSAIREHPGASNREVADGSGIADQGQISKLLSRLERLDLIENVDQAQSKGAPNEWRLTARGERVERATRPM
jgi:AcrR family transcriptional regulator